MVGLNLARAHEGDDPRRILVQRDKSRELGFILSYDSVHKRMTLQYHLGTSGTRVPALPGVNKQISPINLNIVLDGHTELRITARCKALVSRKERAIDELSKLLLRPLLFGDLRETNKILEG